MNTKVLDCTLRDGGYVNDFTFLQKDVKEMVKLLNKAGIDFIELGFLNKNKKENQTTIFTSFEQFDFLNSISKNLSTQYLAMIVYGKYSLDDIPLKTKTKIDGIRITFKKHEIDEALNFIQKIKEKGYLVSANPTGINDYSDKEILDLILKINKMQIDMFAIVDTLGVLYNDELLRIFYLIDHNLNKDVLICFHSHNNLQLSFSNSQELIKLNSSRNLIIDSSCKGLGRGAGNLCTELLIQFLNREQNANYHIVSILKIIDEYVEKLSHLYNWGYTLPYYLASINSCHPNYATFLTDKQKLPVELINNILSSIPVSERNNFNKKVIESLYLKFQEKSINKKEDISSMFLNLVYKRKILILGSGSSLISHRDKIKKFINDFNPFIISLNFYSKEIKSNIVFINNQKRYNFIDKQKIKILASSNLNINKQCLSVDFKKFSKKSDNALVMLLYFLKSVSIKEVYLAGCDGFDILNSNYSDISLNHYMSINTKEELNKIVRNNINYLRKYMKIHFITPSLYEV